MLASISMGITGDEKINLENIGGFMYQKCLENLPVIKGGDKTLATKSQLSLSLTAVKQRTFILKD